MSKEQAKLFFDEIMKNGHLQNEVVKVVGGDFSNEKKGIMLRELASRNNFKFTQDDVLVGKEEIEESLQNKNLESSPGVAVTESVLLAVDTLSSLSGTDVNEILKEASDSTKRIIRNVKSRVPVDAKSSQTSDDYRVENERENSKTEEILNERINKPHAASSAARVASKASDADVLKDLGLDELLEDKVSKKRQREPEAASYERYKAAQSKAPDFDVSENLRSEEALENEILREKAKESQVPSYAARKTQDARSNARSDGRSNVNCEDEIGYIFVEVGGSLVIYSSSKKELSRDNILTIAKKVEGQEGIRAFKSLLKDVHVGGDIEYIHDGTFANCTELLEVTLPESLKGIGDSAFSDCLQLRSIKIPQKVKFIGKGAFAYCKGLTEFILLGAVDEIGLAAFMNCKSLKSIDIPEGSRVIDKHAFAYCKSLVSVSLPNSIRVIDKEAFLGCDSLTDIKWGDKSYNNVNEFFSAFNSSH